MYPVSGGSLRYICLVCGVPVIQPCETDSYTLMVQGVWICLSGEQLTNPAWHCSQVLSSSHASHHAMRRIMECSSGVTLDRHVMGNAMIPDTTRYRSSDGTQNETFHACPVMALAVISLGTHTVLVVCPRPSVASSTAALLHGSTGLVGLNEEWMDVTGSSNESPISACHFDQMVGRTAETAVSMNMSKNIVNSTYVSSTTFMTKITFVLDSNLMYGMTSESLRTMGNNMRLVVEPSEWSMILQESNKMTMRSVMGPTVILTYTGTVSCIGSPVSSPVVMGRFFRAVQMSFSKDIHMKAVKETRRVKSAVWSIDIGSIY